MLYLQSLKEVREEYSKEYKKGKDGISEMRKLLQENKELCNVLSKATNRDGESFLGILIFLFL